MKFLSSRDDATNKAFNNPQVGDLFSERYSFYLYIVHISPDGIISTLEGVAPVTFPDTAELREYEDSAALRSRFAYKSIDGYWISLVSQNNPVEEWYKSKKKAIANG